MLQFFQKMGFTSLHDLRILDVGCGSGATLRRLLDFGAEPENCFGIDLVPKHVEAARRAHPNFKFVEGSAAQLPFPDEEFDLVHQATVFTSVLDPKIKQAIASEVLRTLRPGGHMIWYDFAYSNPRNPNVRGIGRQEIRVLFRGCKVEFNRLTLAPPIARPAARVSPLLCRLLWAFSPLRTHYLCFIQKPKFSRA
jgi:ubiquinone/menaquinone biosynthesis C-methylase UbiE